MQHYLRLIKFSHTIFAMPFALLGYFLGVHQKGSGLEWQTLVLVIGCMVFARSAAMAFNRYVDREIDSRNPRTSGREIPAGVIAPKRALFFVILNALAFVACTYFINDLCFYLSPIALLIILGYSYTKRFTALCHFILGLGLSLAPVGAYLAVTASFHYVPMIYGVAVLFWVAGFDIIYALQDEEFDKGLSLQSIPAFVGRHHAMIISNLAHLITGGAILAAAFLMSQYFIDLQWIHWIGAIVFIGLLFYQHRLVRPDDLSRVNLAFFTTNGLASLIFSALVILDFYI